MWWLSILFGRVFVLMDYHVVSHVIWPWCGDSAGRTWNLPGQQWAKKTHSAQVAQYASGSIKSKSTAKLLVQYGSHPQCFAPPEMWCLQSCYRAEKWAQESDGSKWRLGFFLPAAWQVHDAVVFSNVRWQDHMLGNKNDYPFAWICTVYTHDVGIAFMMVGWSYTMTIACKLTMAYNISSQIPWYAIIVITNPLYPAP